MSNDKLDCQSLVHIRCHNQLATKMVSPVFKTSGLELAYFYMVIIWCVPNDFCWPCLGIDHCRKIFCLADIKL